MSEAVDQNDETLARARRQVALRPDQPDGWFRLCCALLARGDREAAVLLPRLEAFQEYSPGWNALGVTLLVAGQVEAAALAFKRAVAHDPAQAEAWFHLGSLREDAGDFDGAIQAYRAALTARPALHEAAFNLGHALLESHDLTGALEAFATAHRLRPSSFGRIAQALVSGPCGALWLDPERLREMLGR